MYLVKFIQNDSLSLTMSNQSYLNFIESILEEPLDTCNVIDKGWTNLIFDVNDKWIFRFARHAESKQINIETDFLAVFSELSPIVIPSPQDVMTNLILNTQADTPSNFMVYPKIQGVRLSHERLENFSDQQLKQLYKSLGEFLSALHSFNFEHEHLAKFPYGGASFWEDLWPVVETRLKKRTRQKAYDYFRKTIAILDATPTTQTLTHSDLGPNNMLLDASKNKLAGVIDFGDIAIADPAIDFSSFYRNFGRNFVENILTNYSYPLGEHFWLRVDYESKRKLFFVTYFALNYGFEDNISDMISVIEAMF